jgi:hypothetical protein
MLTTLMLVLVALFTLAPAQLSTANPDVSTPAAAVVEAKISADTATFGFGPELFPKAVFYLDLYVFTTDEAEHPMNAIIRITGPLRVQGVSAVSNGWHGEHCTIDTDEAGEIRGLTVLRCNFTPTKDRPQSVHLTVNVPACYSLVPGQPDIRASVQASDNEGNYTGADEYMRVSGGTQECTVYMPAYYWQGTREP